MIVILVLRTKHIDLYQSIKSIKSGKSEQISIAGIMFYCCIIRMWNSMKKNVLYVD